MDRPLWVTLGVAVAGVALIVATIALAGPSTAELAFRESGLRAGQPWSVTLDNVTFTSTNDTITLRAFPGSHSFRTAEVNGSDFVAYPAQGRVDLTSAGAVIPVRFVRTSANVTVQESGLPPGVSWTVQEGPSYHFSNTTDLTVHEADGIHALRVLVAENPKVTNIGPVWIDEDLYLSNASLLTIAVNGSDVVVPIQFALLMHLNWTLFALNVFPNDTALGAPAYAYTRMTFYAYAVVNYSFTGTFAYNTTQNATAYVMTPGEFDAFATTGNATRYLVTTGNVSQAAISLAFDSGTWYFVLTGWSVDQFRTYGIGWSISFPGRAAFFP